MAEDNQLMEYQEVREGVAFLTPAAVCASRKICPSIPTTFPELIELLARYIFAEHRIFTKACHHFQEVVRIRQELCLIDWRNIGQLPPNTVASSIWDVVTDAAQFFNTFPTEEEISAVSDVGIPTSNLAVLRSLLSAKLHVLL